MSEAKPITVCSKPPYLTDEQIQWVRIRLEAKLEAWWQYELEQWFLNGTKTTGEATPTSNAPIRGILSIDPSVT